MGVAERCEGGQEHCPFQDLVPASRGVFAADRGAGAVGDGCETGVVLQQVQHRGMVRPRPEDALEDRDKWRRGCEWDVERKTATKR